MTSYLDARSAVVALLPALSGWTVYEDGVATGSSPPWIVVSFSETDRETSEGGSTSNHVGRLDIRVVGPSERGIGVVCDRLMQSLDHARPPSGGVAPLIPLTDSGTYASDLMVPDSNVPFLMRVLRWRTGWPA